MKRSFILFLILLTCEKTIPPEGPAIKTRLIFEDTIKGYFIDANSDYILFKRNYFPSCSLFLFDIQEKEQIPLFSSRPYVKGIIKDPFIVTTIKDSLFLFSLKENKFTDTLVLPKLSNKLFTLRDALFIVYYTWLDLYEIRENKIEFIDRLIPVREPVSIKTSKENVLITQETGIFLYSAFKGFSLSASRFLSPGYFTPFLLKDFVVLKIQGNYIWVYDMSLKLLYKKTVLINYFTGAGENLIFTYDTLGSNLYIYKPTPEEILLITPGYFGFDIQDSLGFKKFSEPFIFFEKNAKIYFYRLYQ